jgi:hypothetical protein
MKPVFIDVFIHTDETDSLKKSGLPVNLKDAKIEPIKFYVINAISMYTDEAGNKWGCVHSNGSEFISPMSAKELDKLIQP